MRLIPDNRKKKGARVEVIAGVTAPLKTPLVSCAELPFFLEVRLTLFSIAELDRPRSSATVVGGTREGAPLADAAGRPSDSRARRPSHAAQKPHARQSRPRGVPQTEERGGCRGLEGRGGGLARRHCTRLVNRTRPLGSSTLSPSSFNVDPPPLRFIALPSPTRQRATSIHTQTPSIATAGASSSSIVDRHPPTAPPSPSAPCPPTTQSSTPPRTPPRDSIASAPPKLVKASQHLLPPPPRATEALRR